MKAATARRHRPDADHRDAGPGDAAWRWGFVLGIGRCVRWVERPSCRAALLVDGATLTACCRRRGGPPCQIPVCSQVVTPVDIRARFDPSHRPLLALAGSATTSAL